MSRTATGTGAIIVFDADPGAYKRHWGAVRSEAGRREEPPYNRRPLHRSNQHDACVIVSNDACVRLRPCQRPHPGFRKEATFVKEAFVDPKTYRSGSVWDMAFSRDPQQTYIYAANGVDEKINVLLRGSLAVLTSFGDGGRQPGQFFGVHNLATDSKGNLYATETYTALGCKVL